MSNAKPDSESIRSKHAEYLMPSVANYYADSLVLESGSGLTVRDVDGNEYLDFFGGILTVSIGHCDPRVTGPLKEQIDRLGHVSSLYPTAPSVDLAETLARITPGELKKSYFTASGTEADETAVVLAQLSTGNEEIIALRHGYSGRSLLAQALTGHAPWRATPTRIAFVKHAPAPYCYRCPLGLTYPKCDVKCARDIEELIDTTTEGRVAGFLAEPIQGVGGFVTPPAEYFEIATDIVRAKGGVFICDEVQTGFGRTGSKMFGIEHWGVEPEIMTMAKGIANGMPLSATITTDEIAEAFTALTISTYGGNPMSSVSALATIGVIEEEKLADNSEAMGSIMREGLLEIQRAHPQLIGEVRGKGLMIGVEFVKNEEAGDRTPNGAAVVQFFEETKKRGLLIGKGGLYGNVLRISPPLTVDESAVREALRIMSESFDAMENGNG